MTTSEPDQEEKDNTSVEQVQNFMVEFYHCKYVYQEAERAIYISGHFPEILTLQLKMTKDNALPYTLRTVLIKE